MKMKYIKPRVWSVPPKDYGLYHIDGRGGRFPYEEAFVKEWIKRKFCKLFYFHFYPPQNCDALEYYGWYAHWYSHNTEIKGQKCEHFNECYPGIFNQRRSFFNKVRLFVKKLL